MSFYWPQSSSSGWQSYGRALLNEGKRLMTEAEGPQRDIYTLVRVDQEGPFIESAVGLIQARAATLENRYKAYQRNATAANGVASAIWAAKLHMSESVDAAEATIKAAKTELEPQIQAAQAAMQSGLAQSLKLELQARIKAAIQLGQMEVMSAAEVAVGAIGAQNLAITNFTMPRQVPKAGGSPAASPMSSGTGVPAAPAPSMPAPQNPGFGVQNVSKYGVDNSDGGTHTTQLAANNGQGVDGSGGSQHSPQVKPAAATGVDQSGTPLTGTPGSGASQGASGGSVLGKMMSPLSSLGGGGSSAGGGSPLSSLGGGMGNFGNMSSAGSGGAQPASMMNPGGLNPGAAGLPGAGTGAGLGTGTGVGAGAGQGAGLAGLGSGAAETSAKLAAGAVNSVSNGLGAVANAGSNVAQNVAPAAAQLAAQTTPVNPAASTSPASMGGMGGAPPMGMMPPGGSMGGAPPVSSVGGSGLVGPAQPATPPPAAPVQGSSAPPSIQGAPPGAQYAPVGLPQQHHPGIRSLGSDGASGAVLVDQAMAAGAGVVTALLAQTTLAGHIGIDYAVSLIYERTGGVTAWLATSEGASYIPMGVRIPQDVKLAINDPVLGQGLREATAAAGGANPLKVVVEHAKAREMSAVGSRVLAIASSMKMANQVEWAQQVQAQPVEVAAAKFATFDGASAAVATIGRTHHRCEISMPWEWQQANSFDAQGRLRISAKYMHLAMSAGQLNGAASEEVLRLFEMRTPISDELWGKVQQERLMALVEYDTAKSRISYGAPELARLLARARAAEVMESLRHYDTAQGFADLLYATRLAGAPLSPADAAVAT